MRAVMTKKSEKLPTFSKALKLAGLQKRPAAQVNKSTSPTLETSGPKIVWVNPNEVKPDPQNARIHSKQQLRAIERSIRKHGFINPILLTRDNQIVAGHARHAASLRAGLTKIPVIRVGFSGADAKAYGIWDNRSTDLSSFDNRLLGLVFSDLISLEVDIEDTGFSVGEADLLIEAVGECPTDIADEQLDPVASHPNSRAGEVWICGPHKIICGDARVAGVYAQLMNRERASAVFTDVPYNIAGKAISGKGKVRHESFKMAAGEMSADDYRFFLASAIEQMVRYSTDGSIHFHCIDWRHIRDIQIAGEKHYASLLNLCVWAKANAGMGSLYRSQHELVLVYKNGKKPHRNNVELGRHGRNRTNLWQYPGGTTLQGRNTDEGNLLALHPTVKPVQMVADAILDCTARGDIVLDPFLGSGSTLIAAERTGRVCRGIELDPLYVDVAIRRWQRHTGQHAIRASDGRRFDAKRARGERS